MVKSGCGACFLLKTTLLLLVVLCRGQYLECY